MFTPVKMIMFPAYLWISAAVSEYF